MPVYAPSEQSMWARSSRIRRAAATDKEINEKYESREQRILTESNREKLPNFVESLKRPGYLQLRPFYQRRPRWDDERQSKLIESFIINVPVPPIFLYEKGYDSYEVMDGQQRVTAIKSFYDNVLVLKGLELWPELNGKTYSKLPLKIKTGIDRRSISSIVLVKESADTEEEALLIKQLVFERLNTGGIQLYKQEIRNCLYQGKLNTLLLKLSRNPTFSKAWDIPDEAEPEGDRIPDALMDNQMYSRMGDAELVLRFFALRHVENYRDGMHGFLDLYMIRSKDFTDGDIDVLEALFVDTLAVAHEVFGDLIFRPFNAKENKWADRASMAFYDAVMVGISRNLAQKDKLIAKRKEIQQQIENLFKRNPEGTFTGRGNSKADVSERISLIDNLMKTIAES